MVCKRAALFRGRHFTDEIIVLCVRWYLRYSLSYRDLTESFGSRTQHPSKAWEMVLRRIVPIQKIFNPSLIQWHCRFE
jgi:hypothetical protein